jgi:hypothetical protein
MPKSPTRDDLFAIFPDLPWQRHRPTIQQIDQVEREVRHTHARNENIRRQQPAIERVRAASAARRFRPV